MPENDVKRPPSELEQESVIQEIQRDHEKQIQEAIHSKEPPLDRERLIVGYRKNAIFHLAALGLSSLEIAKQLSIHKARVDSLIKGRLAKQEIQRMQNELYAKDQQKIFSRMAGHAAKATFRVMKKKTAKDSDVLSAAGMIMDRAWGKPKQVVQNEVGGIADLYRQLDELNKANKEKEVLVAQFDVLSQSRDNEPQVNKQEDLDDIDRMLLGENK